MLDPLQQITRIRFSDVEVNIAISADRFTLVIPEGTDIIREGGSG